MGFLTTLVCEAGICRPGSSVCFGAGSGHIVTARPKAAMRRERTSVWAELARLSDPVPPLTLTQRS
jgi:hypothetical protein